MSAISISSAWDDTKALLARDGRLFASVALALIVLPAVVMGVVDPRVKPGDPAPAWFSILIVVISLISLAGQLALIRLALGPSVTVAGAISHGFGRILRYILALILLMLATVAITIPFAFAAVAMGMSIEPGAEAPVTGPFLILIMVYLIAILALGTRFLMAMPVASIEEEGPLGILKRSWVLTSGHWVKLFGFLIIFLIGAAVVLLSVQMVVGSLTALMFGARGPMSLAALVESLVQAVATGIFSVLFTLMLARIYVQASGRTTIEKAT